MPLGKSAHLIIVGNLVTVRLFSNSKNILINNVKYVPYDVISIFLKNNLKLLNLSDNADEIDKKILNIILFAVEYFVFNKVIFMHNHKYIPRVAYILYSKFTRYYHKWKNRGQKIIIQFI